MTDSDSAARTVRRTVDLSADTHRALAIWQGDTAAELGVARVTGQDVLIALIDRLLSDDDLAADIRTAIGKRTA
ncbi:hypothetical protein [Nocardia vinacea]|uniref:hypothetical protein n=1 Tax=Nocardia vinacea TaxID=96468 RepID=UPI003F4DF1D0